MKPLLSELFLPCSGMHSPIRANRYPLATITGAQRASGQTHSRARSHQDDADLRADRSTAYLVSCIRVRSAHGNSFVLQRPAQLRAYGAIDGLGVERHLRQPHADRVVYRIRDGRRWAECGNLADSLGAEW